MHFHSTGRPRPNPGQSRRKIPNSSGRASEGFSLLPPGIVLEPDKYDWLVAPNQQLAILYPTSSSSRIQPVLRQLLKHPGVDLAIQRDGDQITAAAVREAFAFKKAARGPTPTELLGPSPEIPGSSIFRSIHQKTHRIPELSRCFPTNPGSHGRPAKSLSPRHRPQRVRIPIRHFKGPSGRRKTRFPETSGDVGSPDRGRNIRQTGSLPHCRSESVDFVPCR